MTDRKASPSTLAGQLSGLAGDIAHTERHLELLRVGRRYLVRRLIESGYGVREVAAVGRISHTEVQRLADGVTIEQPAE
jgi:hypothetical protein